MSDLWRDAREPRGRREMSSGRPLLTPGGGEGPEVEGIKTSGAPPQGGGEGGTAFLKVGTHALATAPAFQRCHLFRKLSTKVT